MSTTSLPLSYTLQPGDQVGPYKIVRPLGAGGMGEVYLAEHIQLRKHYAIKVLPGELSADPQFIDRFRIEARVMADLEHTHIVRVHNFGDEKGRYYLVMDYVEGPDGNPRTLEDELAWGRSLPEAAVREIALQICDALAYAHSFKGEGVIHRDLKPANILIARPPDKATGGYAVKISDFGLAKILGAGYIRTVLERSTTLTGIKTPLPSPSEGLTERPATPASAGFSLLGTYDYMSPEQKVGAGIDARSDMFSVGIILYRMLTGHKPEGAFDPPSKKGVNRAWDRIVGKCLRREASQRYPSIAALRADIARVGIPFYKTSRFMISAVLTGLAAAVAVTHLAGRPRPAPRSEPVATPVAAAIGEPTAVAPTPEPIGETAAVPEPESRPAETPVPASEPSPTAMAALPMGKIQVRSDPGVQVSAQTPDNVILRLGGVSDRGVLKDVRLPEGAYTLRLSRSNYIDQTFDIMAMNGRDVDIEAHLKGLPGRLRVDSERPVEIVLNGLPIGRSGQIVTNLSPGHQTFLVRADHFRDATLDAVIPPNGLVAVKAPRLEAVRATLRIRVEHVPRYENAPVPPRARIRVNREDWKTVALPYLAAVDRVDIQQKVELEVEQYERPEPQFVMVGDGDTMDVVFKLEPLPVRVTFVCNAAASVVAVRQTAEMSLLKSARKFTGIGAIKGRSGEPIELEAFQPYKIEISAPGFVTETLDVKFDRPGQDVRQSVKLLPLPSTLDRAPYQRPRAH